MEAAAVARLADSSVRMVTSYRSVRVESLFARDPDRTLRFVRGRLGGLGVDDDEHARLRATLMVYLDESSSRIATSKRLGIHPNTVANRVRAARALLDSDVAESRVELRAALRLAVTLGSAVLSEPAGTG
jgi:DNA-binding PucR family transcriptional regulator